MSTASYGARSSDAVVKIDARDVRRPVRVVDVCRARRSPRAKSDSPEWQGRAPGTHGGGDRVYTIDITNPSEPVIVDSIQANTRLVNDMMTTADGNYMVFTREGAADRKNGIVIADTHDPLHPKAISEFTDGVTGGVHSAFVYTQPKYGTHVYLTSDATGKMHVIDINDPLHPKQVAEWKTPGSDNSGRYLHDIDIRDGILYGSWWNDGLVMLDIGNGRKGGSPSNPQFVSQYKYDLDKLYREVEAVSGPGFTRGTHTAWRFKNYVFIADEVFPASYPKGTKDAAAGRAYGRLQVLDVSDLAHPKSVAWYEPEYGGVHNVWVLGDTLYMGAYNAGFRAFDISGELRGDLRAQGREIAHLNTADMEGHVKGAMTWGVVVNQGRSRVRERQQVFVGRAARAQPKPVVPSIVIEWVLLLRDGCQARAQKTIVFVAASVDRVRCALRAKGRERRADVRRLVPTEVVGPRTRRVATKSFRLAPRQSLRKLGATLRGAVEGSVQLGFRRRSGVARRLCLRTCFNLPAR